MAFQGTPTWANARPTDFGPTLSVRETLGGYILSEPNGTLDLDLLAEAIMKFFGLVMILSAGAVWLLPNAAINGDPLIVKLAMTAAFMLTGLAIFSYGNRGFYNEIHINIARRELCLATRNAQGKTRITRRIPMREIESCFIRREKNTGAASQLYLRLRTHSQPLFLTKAPEQVLGAVHERLSRDIRGPIDRRMARAA